MRVLVYGFDDFSKYPLFAKNGNKTIALLFDIEPESFILGNSLHPNQY